MSELIAFVNPDFGELRAVEQNGETWFVAADVCRVLEIKNSRDAVSRLDEDEKGVVLTDTPSGKQAVNVVNEPGLYTLVIGSRKKEAKAFKRWITHDVVPSIRKNGGYIAGQEQLSDSELMAKAILVAQKTIEAREARIAELSAQNAALLTENEQQKCKIQQDKPLVEFATNVIKSDGSVSISNFAKMLCSKGMKIGNRRLLWWLRDNKYLMKSFMPYQVWVTRGVFEVVDIHYQYSVFPRAYITPKGQKYIYEKLSEKYGK